MSQWATLGMRTESRRLQVVRGAAAAAALPPASSLQQARVRAAMGWLGCLSMR